jgi:hypothetical protein
MLKFTPDNLNLGRNPIYSQISYNVEINYERTEDKIEDYILDLLNRVEIESSIKQEIIDDIELMNTPAEPIISAEQTESEPTPEPIESSFVYNDISYIEIIRLQSESPQYISVSDTTYNNSKNKIILISGEGTLEIFNLYSITHVNKGQSDKTEEPVVSSIADVPDKKDIYKISVDPRVSKLFESYIDVKLHKKVQIKRVIDSEVVFENDEITEYKNTYLVEISQTYDKIKDWVKNYFENRY